MNRSGIGYDVHRFSEERSLILGGIEIPNVPGLEGHSDADVLCHAIADSLLGAMGMGDIGVYFPPEDSKFKDISSLKILEKCVQLLKEQGFKISNIDSTLIAETPKILPYISQMKGKVSETLLIQPSEIGIKATTNERMGFIGRKEGISALAVCSIWKD